MPKAKTALEFKGRMLSLTRVRILDPDLAAIELQLRNFARQMPQAIDGMPVVLESDRSMALEGVLVAMHGVGMQPIAAIEGPLADMARACGLPVLAPDVFAEAGGRAMPPAAAAAAPVPPPEPPEPIIIDRAVHKPARVVVEPVRSGQQLYAEGGDLILLGAVSAGAEVIADGCVHAYGPMRGRAIAGARGDDTARVFCRSLEAELLAVAGVYAVADQIPAALRKKFAQAWLADGKLRIEAVET